MTLTCNCGDGDSAPKGAVPYVQAFDSLLAGPAAENLKTMPAAGGNKLSDLLALISEQIKKRITFREKN
ncbi:hypothetical protein QTO34_012979 [Cnephaeus nilssonii]|uniref:Uncharacterized protein n=1 Tax=Cnephaeus nilssonii TaxID=3371016 RepID=A0AA40HAN7_CNENI|nr:hypothetical protein QTO34_012979 [Eptesicus nilssonii]